MVLFQEQKFEIEWFVQDSLSVCTECRFVLHSQEPLQPQESLDISHPRKIGCLNFLKGHHITFRSFYILELPLKSSLGTIVSKLLNLHGRKYSTINNIVNAHTLWPSKSTARNLS